MNDAFGATAERRALVDCARAAFDAKTELAAFASLCPIEGPVERGHAKQPSPRGIASMTTGPK
jgi:hypothetical protein